VPQQFIEFVIQIDDFPKFDRQSEEGLRFTQMCVNNCNCLLAILFNSCQDCPCV